MIFNKRNKHDKRPGYDKKAFDVTLKPGIERTPENLAKLDVAREHLEKLYQQHRKNEMIFDIVKKVADGKITDDEARNQIALLTQETIEVDLNSKAGKSWVKKFKANLSKLDQT